MRQRLVLLACLASTPAFAEVELKFGGQIASDIRYRLRGEEVPPSGGDAPYPAQQRLLRYGFSRNENLIKAQLSLSIAERVKAVADVDFYWYGYSDVRDVQSDTLRERVDPYRLEGNAAYVDIYKLLPGLDLRIGRQVVVWGSGDKFNPTNHLNTLDLSDPLLFGRALANNMVRLDYNPAGDFVFTAVFVPIFRPAQLPRTAPLALTELNRPPPVQEPFIRNFLAESAAAQNAQRPISVETGALLPETSLANSQIGLRAAGRIADIDLALTYYHGRWGIPTPAWALQYTTGVVRALVMWPRMDVVGFDMAGSLAALKGLGYWLEAGLFFPQEITYGSIFDAGGAALPVTFEKTAMFDAKGNSVYNLHVGEPEFQRPTVIPATPFLKLTAGLDYSWNQYLYSNLQYVYGFIDEFGAGRQCYARPNTPLGADPRCEARIGHYLVVGSDLKLFREQLLVRLFGAFKVPQRGDDSPRFTAVLFPQLVWAVWDATELSLGAFVYLGRRDTKFGDPAAGASELFLKARFTY